MVVLNTTYEAAPSSPPRDLNIESIEGNPTSVMLQWQPPKQPNGPITGNMHNFFYIIFFLFSLMTHN